MPASRDLSLHTTLACLHLFPPSEPVFLKPFFKPHTQPPEAEARGALQLLDSIDAQSKPPAGGTGIVPLPHGFLEELAAKYEAEGFDDVIRPVGECSEKTGDQLETTGKSWE